MRTKTKGILVLLALLAGVAALGWTPPPNCFLATKAPRTGQWISVTQAEVLHAMNRSSCGGRAQFVAPGATTPSGSIQTKLLLNSMPNSTVCNLAGCVTNYVISGTAWTKFSSNYQAGWFLAGVETYDYLVP